MNKKTAAVTDDGANAVEKEEEEFLEKFLDKMDKQVRLLSQVL